MAGRTVEDFSYPLIGGATGSSIWENVLENNSKHIPAVSTGEENAPIDDVEDEKLARAFEMGRADGIEEGRRVEQREQASRWDRASRETVEQVASMSEKFAVERERFMHALEPQVVDLALRIAERIVRHEVAVDPLMLTASVRVALGQLADNAAVGVRVPAADADLWAQTLEHLPNLRVKPKVIADVNLRGGQCELETSCGSVDLSVANQLREIRLAFFERQGGRAPEKALCSEAQAGEQKV